MTTGVNLWTAVVIISVVAGMTLGISMYKMLIRQEYTTLFYIAFPGHLLLNMLKCIGLPLTVSSVITAMTSVGNDLAGRLLFFAVVYNLATTLLATSIGVIIATILSPWMEEEMRDMLRADTNAGKFIMRNQADAILDFLRQCFPHNLVVACFQTDITEFLSKKCVDERNPDEEIDCEEDLIEAHAVTMFGTNYLGIIVLSMVTAIVINRLEGEGKPITNILRSLNSACFLIMKAIIWYLPVGLMSLTTSAMVSSKTLGESLLMYSKLILATLLALIAYGLFILPLIYFIIVKKNPMTLFIGMARALFTVWAIGSNSTTLSITMDCLLENNIDKNIVNLVVPLGMYIKNDGTALCYAVVCVYIARAYRFRMNVIEIMSISLSLTVIMICVGGMRQSKPDILTIILSSIGLPSEDVPELVTAEWLLGRSSNLVNVWGDCLCSSILDHFYQDSLSEIEAEVELVRASGTSARSRFSSHDISIISESNSSEDE